MKVLKRFWFCLSILVFLTLIPSAHSQTVANIAYTGNSYGYACVFDSNNSTVLCLAQNQNFTIGYGNYSLAVFLYKPGPVFSHWITQGNVTVGDIQGNNTKLEVNGDGSLVAVFFPSPQSQPGNVKFSGVRGYVCFLNYSNSSGPVCLMDGQNATLPTGKYITEASPYNVSDSFVKWFAQGQIKVDNQSSYITNITVNGNGVLGLIYAETMPTPETSSGAVPFILAGSLTCTLLALRRKRKT